MEKDCVSIGNQGYSVVLLGIQDLVFCVQVLYLVRIQCLGLEECLGIL